jgi:fatty acid desaturase
MITHSRQINDFSLAQARAIVRDYFEPKAWVYWIDFLSAILVGHACYGLTRRVGIFVPDPAWLRWTLQVSLFAITCVLYFRAASFIHEVTHLPERKFRAFRFAWNLLCGIPFLMPSFTYVTHLEHHRRKLFGTEHDGEYVPLSNSSPWLIALYLSQPLWVPPLAVVRFLMLTPLTWTSPAFGRWVHQRASSLIMDPRYLRPLPTPHELRVVRIQEVLCFLVLLGIAIVPPVFMGRWPIPFVVHGYLTAVVLLTFNCLRTLAAHRFWSEGHEVTFVEQMLDSVNIDSNSPLEILLNPVGLRYHALHHMFPSLPYHNLPAAHRRLMQQLPADSLYRQTNEKSILTAIRKLCQRSFESQRESGAPPDVASNSNVSVSRGDSLQRTVSI